MDSQDCIICFWVKVTSHCVLGWQIEHSLHLQSSQRLKGPLAIGSWSIGKSNFTLQSQLLENTFEFLDEQLI